jgi:glyoxylase-like metal-dependent hydrolase (beta-lactamase superfamily II)/8-oxo-dGTP pyrophosphatase MutT (NUDIX family)
MDWSQAQGHRPQPPRQSASLIVLRDGERGVEVLLQRRPERAGDQNGGACVFPGGTLNDGDARLHALCDGPGDAAMSVRLGLAQGGLDYVVAAIRECFEEAGLLFGGVHGGLLDLDSRDPAALQAQRHALHAGTLEFAALCATLGVRLAADRLQYFSHWVTPPGLQRRFDTRFFVAVAPAAQSARSDERETVELLWLTPAEALDPARALKLLPVTRATLKRLSTFSKAADVIEHARAQTGIPLMMPRLGLGPKGPRPVLPDDWAYAEIARLDPDGRGDVSSELIPGRAVRLSPRVVRVTANNGSMMTGPGTNSYFVGDESGQRWLLIDPGPDDGAHVKALLDAAPGPLAAIIVTHTHKDHSPAAQAVKAACGAPLWGRVAEHEAWQDASFVPDRVLVHGERIEIGADVGLRVIHTPGHASNHLCLLLEQEKLLFTGDHVMQGSTVVINPPDGDMAAYLASLQQLLGEDLEWLAPGHGFLIDKPHDAVRKVITHRLQREVKVVDALARLTAPSAIDALLPQVYADVAPKLHAMAARSLLAHLIKLRADGRVSEQGGGWRLVR